MEDIKINFVELINQDQSFQLYRSIVPNSNCPKNETCYRTKLPDKSNDHEWHVYDISIDQKDGFELFECHYSLNPSLTKYYIFEQLKNKLYYEWSNNKYEVIQESKYREIRFILSEHAKGNTELIIYPYYLKIKRKFGFLLRFHFNLSENQKFDRQSQILSLSLDKLGKPNVFIYRDKENAINDFLEKLFKPFLENEKLGITGIFTNLPIKILSKKSYVVGRAQNSSSQFMGIKNFGPYQKVNAQVKYLFLFSEKTRALARDTYLGLIGKLFPGQFSGLSNMFDLPISKELVNHHLLDNFDQPSLSDFEKKLIDIKKNNPDIKYMLLAVLPIGFKGVEDTFDAYGYLKLLALKHQIPCQFITEDTFLKNDQLKWSISNIGLQIFSKLGGIPWLVKPEKKDCLILGLGSSHETINSEITKFLAYTVCLDSSGDFKYIKPLSYSKNEQEYLNKFQSQLEMVLKSEFNKNYKSFVLHLPFKIRQSEINIIKKVVSNIRNDSSCEVVILKINTKHHFIGFGIHNTRIPYESSMLQLSSNQFLLWAEGLQHGKEVVHKRISDPILIDFLESSDSLEGKYAYLQDVLNLTGANWRGFNSKAQPISIYYSQLIAKFMKEFSHLEGFEDFSVLNAESVAPWFL